MDENLTSHASSRISGAMTRFGRVSNPSAHPGQNGGFSDGFLTKILVVNCRYLKPGESTEPTYTMKSINDRPNVGFPPDPPYSIRAAAVFS